MESAGARQTNPPLGETTARLVSDEFGKSLYSASEENDAQIAGNLADVAEELDASRAQVALAWLLSKPGVAAPIIGPSRQEQLDDLLQAVDLTLSPEQIRQAGGAVSAASGGGI